jgi:hypothetical protein
MPQKVKNSGKSQHFDFSATGSWQSQVIHGWDIFVDARHEYQRYSPRIVAIAEGIRQFWIQNRGTQFAWRETIGNLRYYVRLVGRVTRDDYNRAKEIIRELGPGYMTPEGELFVYASTRGSNAKAGFIQEPIDAMKYEVNNHQMFQVMEGRVANGTVIPAGAQFAMPVRSSKIKTKTLR